MISLEKTGRIVQRKECLVLSITEEHHMKPGWASQEENALDGSSDWGFGVCKKKRANAKGLKMSLKYVVGRGGAVQGKAVLNIIPSRMYVGTWRLWS